MRLAAKTIELKFSYSVLLLFLNARRKSVSSSCDWKICAAHVLMDLPVCLLTACTSRTKMGGVRSRQKWKFPKSKRRRTHPLKCAIGAERMRVRVYSTERTCVFIYLADWIFSIFSKPRTLSSPFPWGERVSLRAWVGEGGARALQNYGLNAPGGNYSSAFRKLNKNCFDLCGGKSCKAGYQEISPNWLIPNQKSPCTSGHVE